MILFVNHIFIFISHLSILLKKALNILKKQNNKANIQKILKLMSNLGDCIFASSKYYKKSYANAQAIAQPLGYNFLSSKKQQQFRSKPKETGPKIRKILFQKPIIKTLSNKRTLIEKVQQYLSVSDSKRKNTYLSSTPLAIINKANADIVQELEGKFASSINSSYKQTINFVSSFHSISDDAMYSIGDYALSTYFIYHDGKNMNNLNHISKLYNKQFIEYDVRTITSNQIPQGLRDKDSQNTKIQFNMADITQIDKIDQYAQRIKQAASKIDNMFYGVQCFIGDCIANITTYDILKQQIENLKYLQYYLYLLTTKLFLGTGQNAILKIRGTLRHKTLEYLFLFKLIFTKIAIIKPGFSNFISTQKYLILQGYVRQNGQIVHKYLTQNFNLLAQFGEQKLLINPQLIFRQQFLTDNTKNFNDTLIIKGLKQVIQLFLRNSNLQIYPPKSLLMEKLKSFDNGQIFDGMLTEIEENIPIQEQIKNDAQNADGNKIGDKKDKQSGNLFKVHEKPQIQQKQPQMDIFAFLKAKQQIKQPEKPSNKQLKPKINEQEQLEKQLQQRYKQQQKIKQQIKKKKKQKQKKQKQQKKANNNDNEDPYVYTSHFDYAEG